MIIDLKLFRMLVLLLILTAFSAPTLAVKRLELMTISGSKISPLVGKDRKATVFFFITHDCPISNSYAPEIERIYKSYSSKKIAFFLVYVDPTLSAKEARKHHSEFAYTCPALLDPKHELVKLTSATVTPEAVAFSADGKLLYRGRIDDRAADFGKVRAHPNQRDLRVALENISAGKKVARPITKPVGCFIADLSK